MFIHSTIARKGVHQAHGHEFSIWILFKEETQKICAYVSRSPASDGDPVAIMDIEADEDFGVDKLFDLVVGEINNDPQGIFAQ